jgi:hypothetical protein
MKRMVLAALLLGGATEAWAQESPFGDPERTVRDLYAAVSMRPGAKADWDRVRAFFHPEVVLAVRRTPGSMDVIGLDEFIAWFQADVARTRTVERGFEESVVRLDLTVFGDMAQAFVVYRARMMTPADARAQLGLDNFGLVRMDGRWWIVSVTNDVVTPSLALPPSLAVPDSVR